MKPNIVIVMTDQQRASLRKGRGFALDTMPFLDSWAQEGTDFHCAYTSNPTCMPARVSMFSGRYPSATHVRSNANVEDAFYTEDLLDVVRKNGYLTACAAKITATASRRILIFTRPTSIWGPTTCPVPGRRKRISTPF